VLDIGAGMGVFLYAFLDSKWEGVAVEPDRYCCELMKQKMSQATILNGYSSEVPHTARYDLITLNRVLEHIKNPLPVLREEYDHLNDDGILYIELPDVWSYFYDGPNNEAFGYGHFIVYSPAALELLARGAGFELIHLNRVNEPSTKFSLYAFFRKRGSGPRLAQVGGK
jgi:SAM-dependent methyltransferase